MRHLTDVREVPVRSRVLTSGLGGVFPKGIKIGTLLIVTNKMREVTGEVSPSVDFSTLEDVFIRREK
jgi:rod shape-determining protein MreC